MNINYDLSFRYDKSSYAKDVYNSGVLKKSIQLTIPYITKYILSYRRDGCTRST